MFNKQYAAAAAAALVLCAGAAQANGFANGGFETANSADDPPGGVTYFAQGWLAAPTGNPAMWSTNARTGAHSALLTVPNGSGGSTLLQNSIDHGGLPALTAANVGDTPLLSFYAKGDVGETGNVLFALRYLSDTGGILGSSGNKFFHPDLKANDWTQISFQAGAIPAGTKALFLEMNTAVGGLGAGRTNAVYIDDITISGLTSPAPIPEPETYALMLLGLAGVGWMARRRRPA